ncbi:hypothetical protein SPYJRS4_1366 [Streptococcus pyogenes JRS4]|nr:hypothetical protein SPYJRS4_1366 [Streptococcus pyogenes JRS4]
MIKGFQTILLVAMSSDTSVLSNITILLTYLTCYKKQVYLQILRQHTLLIKKLRQVALSQFF